MRGSSTLGEVASTLAHELNQPLTSIVSYSAGIAKALEKHARTPSPNCWPPRSALSRHAAQAGGIVHRIRTRLARRELVLEPCDINPMVADAVTLLQREFKRVGAQVSLELQADLPPARLDRIGIEQVVTNLLRNACDAMAGTPYSQTITIRSYRSFAPPLGDAQGWVTVEVTDQGPGLGGRDIETLTEPFFSTKKDGTGLGLAICRSILESHGGVLHAQDAPAGGARFSFSLPPEHIQHGDEPAMTEPTIYLCDDDEGVRSSHCLLAAPARPEGGHLRQRPGIAGRAGRRHRAVAWHLRAGCAHGAAVRAARPRGADQPGAGQTHAGAVSERPRRHSHGRGRHGQGGLQLCREALCRRCTGPVDAARAGTGSAVACAHGPPRRPARS